MEEIPLMKYHPEEFIGSEICVINAENKNLIGISGKIIDETKNTFKLLTKNNEEKILMKKGITFALNQKTIDGNEIIKRPEDRTKRK